MYDVYNLHKYVYVYITHIGIYITIYHNIKKLLITFRVPWDILSVRIKALWLKYNMYMVWPW